jgi:hypothetical protein
MLISHSEGERRRRPTHDDDNRSIERSLPLGNNTRLDILAKKGTRYRILCTATTTTKESARVWQEATEQYLLASDELVPADEVPRLSKFVDVHCSDHIIFGLST